MAAFPGAIPTFAGFTSTHTLAADNHAAQHNLEQAEVVAIATKVGTGASTPVAGSLLRATGLGTSGWGQADLTTDVTGVLPQANGGTGRTDATGSGAPVYQTSPTIVTPTIADLTNMQHDHTSAAEGGPIPASAIPALDLSDQALTNPYKFKVTTDNATTLTSGGYTKIQWGTEVFDSNGNFDTTNDQYTIPVSGYYMFTATINATAGGVAGRHGVALYTDGVISHWGVLAYTAASVTTRRTVVVFDHFTAGEVVSVYGYVDGANATIVVDSTATYFSGALISHS